MMQTIVSPSMISAPLARLLIPVKDLSNSRYLWSAFLLGELFGGLLVNIAVDVLTIDGWDTVTQRES